MRVVFDIGGTATRVGAVTSTGIGAAKNMPTPKEPGKGIAALMDR